MLTYKYSMQDVTNQSYNRCFFEAEQGWINVALERVKALKLSDPSSAHPIYAEGLLRKNYLGQGLQAAELFQCAFNIDNTLAEAACNAAFFARNDEEYERWIEKAKRVAPHDEMLLGFEALCKKLGRILSLRESSRITKTQNKLGHSAAILEIILADPYNNLSWEDEEKLRQIRIFNLIKLDKEKQRQRLSIGEVCPVDELIVTNQALKEISDLTISEFGKYNADNWNNKAFILLHL